MRHGARSILMCAGALWGTLLQPVARADDLTACVSEITRVCAGMVDHLENCVVLRRDAMSASCRTAAPNSERPRHARSDHCARRRPYGWLL